MCSQFPASEQAELQSFMQDFLDICFTERDYKKAGACVADNVMCVGLRLEEIGQDRAAMEKILEKQVDIFPSSVEYYIIDEIPKDLGNHWWHYYAQIALRAIREDWGIVRYIIRLMATVCKTPQGWKIQAIHISEAGVYGEPSQKIAFASDTPRENAPRGIHRKDLGRALNQLLPGGIVSRIPGENFGLSFVNNQFLRMSGYETQDDLQAAVQNSFLNLLHPEDVKKYCYTAEFLLKTGKQCECDYRIRRKDGSFLWIHDVGRKAEASCGQILIVSVVTDISHRVERLQALEKESEIDYLTNVYNRKGAIEHVDRQYQNCSCCALLIIDLDNFKQVNDLYGHSVGDQALQITARLLADTFRNTGIVCRLGGDEFTVFIPEYQDPKETLRSLETISEKYRTCMKDLAPAAGTTLSIGGVYGTKPISHTQRYQFADANLYKIKHGKKDGILLTSYDT